MKITVSCFFACLFAMFAGCAFNDGNLDQPDAAIASPDANVTPDAPPIVADAAPVLPDSAPVDAFVCSPAACDDGKSWTNDFCVDNKCVHAPGDCGGIQVLPNSATNKCKFSGGFNDAPVVEWTLTLAEMADGSNGPGWKVPPNGACDVKCGRTSQANLADSEVLPMEKVTVEWKGVPVNQFVHQEYQPFVRSVDWAGNAVVYWTTPEP